jgi:hypothetical protein
MLLGSKTPQEQLNAAVLRGFNVEVSLLVTEKQRSAFTDVELREELVRVI